MEYKLGVFLCALLQVLLWQPVLLQWSFSVPRQITALEGSCLVIPCTFTGSIDRRLTFAWILWRSNSYPEVYNNKGPTNVLPRYKGRALLVGDLEDHNCTLQINSVTREDADDYYPLIDLSYSHRVSVEVSGTPERPTVTYPPTMTEMVPRKITCYVEHTCPAHPPTLAWDKIKGNVSVYHEELLDGIWRTVLVLTYTPAAEHHMEDFVCSATYPSGKSASRSITFFIRYAPKNTTAAEFFYRKTIKEGDTVTLLCSSRGNPEAETYGWFEGPLKTPTLGYAPLLTLKNISWDSGPYICTATNDVGTGESPPLHLNIQHAAKGVHAVLPEVPEEGKPMELSCATESSNPRATLYTWYKNEEVIQEGKTLKIESTAMDDSGVYRCVAHNAMGSSSSAPVTVDVKPSINFSIVALVTGVLVAVLAAAIGAILLTRRYLNNKKKKNFNISNQLTQLSRHDEGQNPFQNVDNVYAALDGTQATSEYEDIRRNYVREETTHTIDCHC